MEITDPRKQFHPVRREHNLTVYLAGLVAFNGAGNLWEAVFINRAEDSATHKLEAEFFDYAGGSPTPQRKPVEVANCKRIEIYGAANSPQISTIETDATYDIRHLKDLSALFGNGLTLEQSENVSVLRLEGGTAYNARFSTNLQGERMRYRWNGTGAAFDLGHWAAFGKTVNVGETVSIRIDGKENGFRVENGHDYRLLISNECRDPAINDFHLYFTRHGGIVGNEPIGLVPIEKPIISGRVACNAMRVSALPETVRDGGGTFEFYSH